MLPVSQCPPVVAGTAQDCAGLACAEVHSYYWLLQSLLTTFSTLTSPGHSAGGEGGDGGGGGGGGGGGARDWTHLVGPNIVVERSLGWVLTGNTRDDTESTGWSCWLCWPGSGPGRPLCPDYHSHSQLH